MFEVRAVSKYTYASWIVSSRHAMTMSKRDTLEAIRLWALKGILDERMRS